MSEAVRDRAMLWWVGRFRFVTSVELAIRFGVTEQRVNARVRRLLGAGLLGAMGHITERRLVYLSQRGSRAIGFGERRPPRSDLQVRHELAIVQLVAEIETGLPPGESFALTERECRRAERRGEGRFSVEVAPSPRNETRRWPDVVVSTGDGLVAIEIELSPKTSQRLQRIISGYGASDYSEVVFLVEGDALRDRINALVEHEREAVTWRAVTEMRAHPWRRNRGGLGQVVP